MLRLAGALAALLAGLCWRLRAEAISLADESTEAEPEPTCFHSTDYSHMFSASTRKPDSQLAAYLRSHPASIHYPTFDEVHLSLFHTNTSIYDGFQRLPPIPYGGGVRAATINFIRSVASRPVHFMVEVGSFVGSSATMFGKHLLAPDGLMLCIDTWAGDINMWLLDSFVSKMARRHGSPQLYEQFLSRMLSEGLESRVIPLRTSSTVGARILAALKYRTDLIYLDSAHEAGETYFELNLYWDLLSEGGVLCGDDYHQFPAVKHDVDLFLHHRKLPQSELVFSHDRRTWAIVKRGNS